jgi:hypothetical protein
MKEATKRVSSEALAQMLAVVAMAVIASILFFGNSDTRRASAGRTDTVGQVSAGQASARGSGAQVDAQNASFSK